MIRPCCRRRRAPAAAVVVAVWVAGACVLGVRSAAAADWRHLFTKDGVRVEALEVPGCDLPRLRGVATIDANLYEILAVIDDVPAHRAWVPRIQQSRVLKRPAPTQLWMYTRFDFPWPTSDRDSVLRVQVGRRLQPRHEVVLRTWRDPSYAHPAVADVVRVPRSEALVTLRLVTPTRTEISYEVDIDPGGSLPRFVVRWLLRDMPRQLVRGLAERVAATSGRYGAFCDAWDPARGAPASELPVPMAPP